LSILHTNITSQSSSTAAAGFADILDLVDTVTIEDSGNVVLLIAVVPLELVGSEDECADFRFAIDDVLVGPEVSAFKDEADEGCGVAICWAATGLSGSTKFALQWRIRQGGSPETDTGRVRSFQVIEITDASILVNLTATSSDDAVSGYTDINDLTDTKTPAGSGSVLLMLANMNGAMGTDRVATFQFTVGGTGEGPESKSFIDNTDEGCGISHIWMKTGVSGSTAFALQWDELIASYSADTGRVRSFQIIEITANANLLTEITSVAADTLTSSYTDVVDLVDTITVDGVGSILLFTAMIPQKPSNDRTGAYRIHEGATGEGPEQYVMSDATIPLQACGHSLFWARTGISSGSHTFSVKGQHVTVATVDISEDERRSFCILELLPAVAQEPKTQAVLGVGY